MRVLVVDNDAQMRKAVWRLLSTNGIVAVPIVLDAWPRAAADFDAVLVSCTPPVHKVSAAITNIRTAFAGPIVCHSALHWSDEDCAMALDAGADAFIAFPFFRNGLVASQLRALVRRSRGAGGEGGIVFVAGVEVDLTARCIVRGASDVSSLSRNEATILRALVACCPKPVSYEQVHVALGWKVSPVESRALKQAIVRLRRKLGGDARVIECVTGFGYRLASARADSPRGGGSP